MRFPIKLKLALAFASIIVLSGLTAWVGISNLAFLDATLVRLLDGPAHRVELSLELNNELLSLVRSEKNLITAAAREDIDRFESEVLKGREALLSELEKAEAGASEQGRPKWTSARSAVQQWMAVQDKIRV